MSGLHQNIRESSLFSTAGTWGQAQIVAVPDAVVIDITTRNYDNQGRLHKEHALANLSLETAIRLHGLLAEAIAAADGMEPRQCAFSLGFAAGTPG